MDAPRYPVDEFHASPGFVVIIDADKKCWLKVKDAIHPVPYMNLFTSGVIRAWEAKKER